LRECSNKEKDAFTNIQMTRSLNKNKKSNKYFNLLFPLMITFRCMNTLCPFKQSCCRESLKQTKQEGARFVTN